MTSGKPITSCYATLAQEQWDWTVRLPTLNLCRHRPPTERGTENSIYHSEYSLIFRRLEVVRSLPHSEYSCFKWFYFVCNCQRNCCWSILFSQANCVQVFALFLLCQNSRDGQFYFTSESFHAGHVSVPKYKLTFGDRSPNNPNDQSHCLYTSVKGCYCVFILQNLRE